MYDVIVIGTGPAGLSAAINVRQRGGSVLCVGTALENNPLLKAERVDNYLGLPGMTGKQLLDTFLDHAKKSGAEFLQERVLNTYHSDNGWMVSAGSQVLECRCLIFTGGIMRGKPYPGEQEHIGMGVSYCATCDGMLYRGKNVAVIGFGPADREEAEYLEGIGCKVRYFEKPKKVEIRGEGKVSSALVDQEEVAADCVFVLRPSLAPSSLFPELELEDGYIRTDRMMHTNLPGLYAAGDCTGRPLQVSKAVGEGLIAGQQAADEAKKMK